VTSILGVPILRTRADLCRPVACKHRILTMQMVTGIPQNEQAAVLHPIAVIPSSRTWRACLQAQHSAWQRPRFPSGRDRGLDPEARVRSKPDLADKDPQTNSGSRLSRPPLFLHFINPVHCRSYCCGAPLVSTEDFTNSRHSALPRRCRMPRISHARPLSWEALDQPHWANFAISYQSGSHKIPRSMLRLFTWALYHLQGSSAR
jgi:hypothetical protein